MCGGTGLSFQHRGGWGRRTLNSRLTWTTWQNPFLKNKKQGCSTGLVGGVLALQSQEPESRSHKRTQGWQNTFVISVLGRWGQEGIGSSLAGQPSWIGGLQVQWESLSQKKKLEWRVIEEYSWHWPLTYACTHTCTHTFTNMYMHIPTPHIYTHMHT